MIRLQDKQILDKFDFKDPAIWIATWFGSGFLKPAPGTWGTVAALPFGIALYVMSPIFLIAGICFVLALGLWASCRFTKAAGEKDSSMIVVDEVVGMWIALLPVAANPSILSIFLAFLLFRFFDILKPWPISFLDQKIEGAAGVMADDILAGVFAAFCMIGLSYVGLG